MSQLVNSAIRSLVRHPEAFPPFALSVKNLGWWNYLRTTAALRALPEARGGRVQLYSRYAKYPLLCRRQTSDFQVFIQIYLERESLGRRVIKGARRRVVIDEEHAFAESKEDPRRDCSTAVQIHC